MTLPSGGFLLEAAERVHRRKERKHQSRPRGGELSHCPWDQRAWDRQQRVSGGAMRGLKGKQFSQHRKKTQKNNNPHIRKRVRRKLALVGVRARGATTPSSKPLFHGRLFPTSRWRAVEKTRGGTEGERRAVRDGRGKEESSTKTTTLGEGNPKRRDAVQKERHFLKKRRSLKSLKGDD